MTLHQIDTFILYFAHHAMVAVYVILALCLVAGVLNVGQPDHTYVWWATAP